MMKVGLIRCLNKEANCTTGQCLQNIKQRSGELEAEEKLTLVGIVTCGGCPGKKIGARVERMLNEAGADKVILAGCISEGENCQFTNSSCSHWEIIKSSLYNLVNSSKVIEL